MTTLAENHDRGNTLANRTEIRHFLDVVVGSVPEGHYLLFWTLPDKQSIWAAKIDDKLVDDLQSVAERDSLYIGVGLCQQNMGPTLRAKAEEVSGIFGFWADIDIKGPAHKKPNLPPTVDDALALLDEMGATPTVIVHSGHGLQAWWLFKEPWIFEDDDERKAAASLSDRWTKTLRLRAKAHGWDVDATQDLSRVLRLPGSINRKIPPHVPVTIFREHEARYEPNDFEQRIQVGAEHTDEKTADLSWSFTLNADAEPPALKFSLLCEVEPIFLQTFKRKRPEFTDQSASSYDLALATRAMIAGWSTQEIVNLLIAHRRQHGDDLKLREDYYRRTLNKAATGKTLELRTRYMSDGAVTDVATARDTNHELEALSKRLGLSVGIGAIWKRGSGQGTSFEFQLKDGRHVVIGAGASLLKFAQVQAAILDSTNQVLKHCDRQTWTEIVAEIARLAIETKTVTENEETSEFIRMFLDREDRRHWSSEIIKYELYIEDPERHPVKDAAQVRFEALQELRNAGSFLRVGKGVIAIRAQGLYKVITDQCGLKWSYRDLGLKLGRLGFKNDRLQARYGDKTIAVRVWLSPADWEATDE